MYRSLRLCTAVLLLGHCAAHSTAAGPFDGQTFRGRIAFSTDGNHNDPDDWIASPMALAILAEMGVKDRLVHFDYNCILPLTDPQWEKTHAESVLGAVERYGYDRALFHDCRKDRDAAIASIARAIDASSADDPLYFIIAGPMEIPYLGIQRSRPEKRQFVYCISHSRWNDGFAAKYQFTFTKRSVIEQDIHWVQIADQNRLLSFGRFGTPSPPEEFQPYFWMRDTNDAKVKFLWERMLVSTRPDPSDAGMTWFLVTGDQECTPEKLRRLLVDKQVPAPQATRKVRLEAENFRHLEGFQLEDQNDRGASHRLQVQQTANEGRIRTRLAEPYAPQQARYNVEVRYFDASGAAAEYALRINGTPPGAAWKSPANGAGWTTHAIGNVAISVGDEIEVSCTGAGGKLDYVQLNVRPAGE
jgi:hypothetical protein